MRLFGALIVILTIAAYVRFFRWGLANREKLETVENSLLDLPVVLAMPMLLGCILAFLFSILGFISGIILVVGG